MNIRKLFNVPTKAQKHIIEEEQKEILNKCQVIADSEHQEQEEMRAMRDGICPLCGKKNIVNKIILVQGTGSVNGIFRFGFGSVNGVINIDTNEINHCAECGNEWKKYKTKSISQTQILKLVFVYFQQILNNPEEKKYSWKVDTIRILDGYSAEAIYGLRKKNKKMFNSKINSNLTLREFRKHFKSLWEKYYL